ncbi:MAG: spore cortex biosynthesis protein YabQ [Clostridia bacterium]|nr:spore cortex biosynthesis protein YabQ [Clostridia bacterium]
MSTNYLLHSLLALWSLILGAFLGFVYEFFRISHRFHPKAAWLICIEDLLFACICSVGMMLLFFNLSFGRMRFFAFPGVILGFVIWYFTLGRLFRRICMGISRRLYPPVRYIKGFVRTVVRTYVMSFRARHGLGARSYFKRRTEDEASKNQSGG